jgi:transposase
MSKTYRPYEPDQMFLLPPAQTDWLPEGHLVYFLRDAVSGFDLSAITTVYEREERGYPPYHPQMMVGILLYAYCLGVTSSRKIARRLEEDVSFRVLAANNTPDFRTIADFRKRHLTELAGLFVQVLRLCQKAGLVKLGHVSLDGTKLKANASKHKAMSYKRMKSEEARLMAEVKALLRQAEATDEREDAEYGATRRGDELSEELAFRESRLKKIREARAELEREAREEAEKRRREIDDRKSSGPRRGRPPKAPDETPAPKDQKNFTDPESRIMPASGEKKSFIHGYNCQAAVDQSSQVIVAAEVTQDTNDKKQGVPLIEQVLTNMEKIPVHVSMDAGYFSEETIGAIESLGIEAFIPPDRQKHTKPPPPAPRGRIPKSLGVADRMRRKLQTKRGRAIYEKRKETVEPVFGQIKQARGIRQFLLRGVIKVKAEWMLICTGHNLLKLWKAIPSG